MERLFLSLVNRSIAAGWLILAVVILRLVLKKAPKSLRLWLWALVAVRLVCPRFGESPLSLLPSAETVPQAVLTRDAFFVQSGLSAFNSVVNEQLVDYYETTPLPAGHTRSFVFVCAAVWLAGMALMALWAAASDLRLRRRVAEAVPEGGGVWICDRIDSPFLLGLFRPRIYLPVGLDGAGREYVLAHERAHIRRRDYLIKPLGLLLLTVYWFQPLAWAAYILLCRDIELACDERVVLELGEGCKKSYSAALLECSVHRSGIAACPLAFGEVGVKERVKHVLHYKKPAFWVVLACAAMLIAVGVCFLTDPVSEPGYRFPDDYVKLPNPPGRYHVARDTYVPKDEMDRMQANQGYRQEASAFAAGALLYMDWAMSYQPVGGGGLGLIQYTINELAMTNYEGETVTYSLDKTTAMAWDNLYDYFPKLAEEEEYFGTLLTDHNDLVITARFYSDGSGDPGPSVWTIQEEGGGQRLWLYYGGRLFALINLDSAFPFLANGALWTYAPGQSDILPVRFDLESGAEVYAGPDGLLSLDPRGDEWVEHLEVENGQTVYWKPPLDQDGKPVENAGLHYYYTCQLSFMNTPYQGRETLTIRPAMDYAGLYGGVTYGVSNNWLGAASSQTHFTHLTVDSETYDLVVAGTDAQSPYELRDPESGIESAQGLRGPVPEVHNAGADQAGTEK